MRLRGSTWAVLSLALIGGFLLGQGLYIQAKALLAQELLQSAWQRTLRGQALVKPWPWADTWPVARLKVQSHGIDTIVLAGDSGRVLAFGPGMNFGFALPGAPGTSVISAHRDTHFRFLEHLKSGEKIEVEDKNGHWFPYEVTSSRIIDSRVPLEWADDATSTLVLITCYPFDALVPGGPLRFVVTAKSIHSV